MVSATAADRFLTASWLADMDSDSRRALLDVLQEGRSQAGVILLAQDQPNDHITFLIEGSAVITRSYPNRPEEQIATLTAPAPFGETSFFRSRPAIVSVRSLTPVWYLTLTRGAYQSLRRTAPGAAEQFALATVRVLAERFDLLDHRVSDFLAEHGNGLAKASEWAAFRARLFEDSLY